MDKSVLVRSFFHAPFPSPAVMEKKEKKKFDFDYYYVLTKLSFNTSGNNARFLR
jgi:hypothetical protein